MGMTTSASTIISQSVFLPIFWIKASPFHVRRECVEGTPVRITFELFRVLGL